MDKPKTTPKDFFLWAGAIVAFYWSVISCILLIFNYINYTFPNALAYYPSDPYQSGISYQMASIIVLFPIYMLLMWIIRKEISQDSSRKEIWVRRWALILTLFVAGIVIAGDLITLLTTFLNGEEMTTAFLLKVLVIFLIVVGIFINFIADLRGYWDMFPKRRKLVCISVSILAIITVVAGFFIVGTPANARLARFDSQRVNDLQNIQSQVITYWQAKQKLPSVISDLNNSLSYGPLPVDPQTKESYVYKQTDTLSFKLCATFNARSRGSQISSPEVMEPYNRESAYKGMVKEDNWQHERGQVCFDRTIDPSFYPPLQ